MKFSSAKNFKVHQLGRCDFEVAEKLQQNLIEQIVAGDDSDHLIVCELNDVLTVGRAADVDNYENSGLPVHSIPRGGKATFHGPGQIVIYPIIKLAEEVRDLHAFMYTLEEAIILCLNEFGLKGERDERNTGVWVNGKKLASIGIAVRKWVTYHGLALNVATDLQNFYRFDPCGLQPDLMSSVNEQLGAPSSIAEIQSSLIEHLEKSLRT